MQLNDLKPNTQKANKRRVGRGGKRGKTSGRGHKGQKQHGGHGIRPQMRDFIKKLPKLRGHGVNRSKTVNNSRIVYTPVNLDLLEERFKSGEEITNEVMLEKGIVKNKGGKINSVKILARGKLTKKLFIKNILTSKAAKDIIEKNGGKVE